MIALPNWETDYIQSKISSSGEPYEYPMLRSMAERLNPGDLVLDVGANIGNHTLYLAAITGCVVHSFEPNASLCNALKLSVQQNALSESVYVHNTGVGSVSGKAKFANEDSSNLGGQSLSLTADENADIEIIRLDDQSFDRRVSAIKIDVEGMEIDVLEGASSLIKRDKPLLYVECQTKADFEVISKNLADKGYVYRQSYNATPTHLFIHRAALNETDGPETTAFELRADLYDRDDELHNTRESLNLANLKYRQVNEQAKALKSKLEEAAERERERQKQIAMLTEQRDLAQQSLFFVLRKNVHRLMRQVRTPGGMLNLLRRVAKRLLRLPVFFVTRARKKLYKPTRLSSADVSIVPPRDLEKLNTVELRGKPQKQLKVACIMDDFTYSSYEPECQLYQLTPRNWLAELEECVPELLLIESAWRGKDGVWGSKVGHTSRELQEIVKWCRERGVPTAFWNKEDPVHFETFLNTARLFDFVYTTDIDCVPRYKASLGHNEVYFLPFACQPLAHNPLEKYERKDAFCFAGAYYVRYPERTKDLEEFIQTLPKFRPFDIYDRNYGKDDPNYAFPEAFHSHIVGTLPFSEIDKAYKGYRYAINLNSIKQSQTMFARRVYELLGSNTLTVSNFSRGLRLMFGDLVRSSDNGQQLVSELESLESGKNVDRIRLAALRKVLSEHTYEARFAYIVSKVSGEERKVILPSFCMVGLARSEHEVVRLYEQWERQKGIDKKLTIIIGPKLNESVITAIPSNDARITWMHCEKVKELSLRDISGGCGWTAGISCNDYYGPNFLLDMALATRYTNAKVIGKGTLYEWCDGDCQLVGAGEEYSYAVELPARSSSICEEAASEISAYSWVNGLDAWEYSLQSQLSIDRFNYCRSAPAESSLALLEEKVDDLELDVGVPLNVMNEVSESALPMDNIESGNHALTGAFLAGMITRKHSYMYHHCQHDTFTDTPTKLSLSKNPLIEAEIDGQYLSIVSRLADGGHEYIYCPESISLDRLASDVKDIRGDGLPLHLEVDPGLSVSLVIIFLDSSGEKLSHAIEPANKNNLFKVPEAATSIRLGIRIYSNGITTLRRLVFGMKNLEPSRVFGKSDVLLITNNYPSYDDLYRNGFVHSRVKGYREYGTKVDVFRFRPDEATRWSEFEGIDLITGPQEVLANMLASGQYRHILVHFLDELMWGVISEYIEKYKVTVWLHGAEIHPWHRRRFNILDQLQEKKAKQESDQRTKFWEKLLKEPHENLHFVFVSETFAKEVMEDYGVSLTDISYSIIHNPINTNLFSYTEKTSDQRKKILSIRPYASRQYANDLSVEMIVGLSKDEVFHELEFRIIGDGPLFDEVTKPIQDFPNVIVEKRFVAQNEIATLHKNYGIFLCPTRWDSQGVSRDEAMSSGLVPITNAVAAIPEFVDGDSGILCAPESPIEMAHKLKYLLQNEEAFLALSRSAAQRVNKNLSFSTVIPKELSLFEVGTQKSNLI